MDYETLQGKISNKEYNTKLPYPKYAPNKNAYEKHFDTEAKKACREDENRLRGEFEKDLRSYAEYELSKTLTDKQWGAISHYAWEEGHSNGYNEVLIYADNLLDIIREFI